MRRILSIALLLALVLGGQPCLASQAKAKARPGRNDVLVLVHQWFAALDRLAPEGQLRKLLSDTEFEILFSDRPEWIIRDGDTFKKWYKERRKGVTANTHEVGSVKIGGDGVKVYEARMTVRRQGTRKDGQPLDETERHSWRLRVTPDMKLVITRMVVEPGK